MAEYWKTGELAKLTGLSIRTLRYYDQIELVRPTAYTTSGHRRYTADNLRQLLEILTLKQMGLTLDEIKQLVLESHSSSLLNTLDNQIERVYAHLKAQQLLLDQLERTKEELIKKESISISTLTTLFDFMKVNHAGYFDDKQLKLMREQFQSLDEKTASDAEENFTNLLKQLRQKKEKQISPSDRDVKELARKWNALLKQHSASDQALQENAARFYADHPELATKVGIEPDLYQYIQTALLS